MKQMMEKITPAQQETLGVFALLLCVALIVIVFVPPQERPQGDSSSERGEGEAPSSVPEPPVVVERVALEREKSESASAQDAVAKVYKAGALVESTVYAYGIPRARAERLAEPLILAARRNDVPVLLFASVVMTESSFRVDARSHAGAIGPAQVIPRYWEDGLCEGLNLEGAEDNLECGARILQHYHAQCDGDWRCALHRYNVGPGALARNEPGAQEAAGRYEHRISTRLGEIDADVSWF